MTDKKPEETKQEAETRPAAEARRQEAEPSPAAEARRQEVETRAAVEMLASILNEVRNQVACTPAAAIEGEVLRAVEQFRAIGAALALTPAPTVTLKAEPAAHGVNGGISKLTWSSIGAQTVTIDKGVGVVTPPAGGAVDVRLTTTTTFTATATNQCGSATAPVTVTVAIIT